MLVNHLVTNTPQKKVINTKRTIPQKAKIQRQIGRANIFEKEDSWNIQLLAPGFDKEDLAIGLEDRVLTIKGSIKVESENLVKREFRYGEVHKTFKLPKFIQEDKVIATLNSGILNIIILKSEEAKPSTIQVN